MGVTAASGRLPIQQGNEKRGWQLIRRFGHEDAPIGQPIGQQSERVELLTGE